MRLTAKPLVLAILLAGCSSDPAAPTSSGPTTVITAVKSTIEGYVLTVRVTNSDTGEIIYGPYCPGRVERREGPSVWRAAATAGVCRTVGRGLGVGQSLTFDVSGSWLDTGSQARYVFEWNWMNGNGPIYGESISPAVTVK